MTRRFDVISDGSPEGDRAAESAQKILDHSISDETYRQMIREAARLASQGLVTGVDPSPVDVELALERIARTRLTDLPE